MTVQDFANANLNTQLDNGQGGYRGECVSLAIRVAQDVYGVPYGTLYCSKTGGARDLFEQFDGRIPQYFDRIANDPNDYNQLPQPGDFIVWGSSMGSYGHIGVVLSGNPLRVFQQLGTPVFKKTEIKQYANYNGVLGWLRPKTQGGLMIVQDAPNWEGRVARTYFVGTGEYPSREQFLKHVGDDFLHVAEQTQDGPKADQRIADAELGKLARKDDWAGQIYKGQAKIGELEDTLKTTRAASDEKDKVIKNQSDYIAKLEKNVIDPAVLQQISETNTIVKSIRGSLSNFIGYVKGKLGRP